jgi:hypothetical protein
MQYGRQEGGELGILVYLIDVPFFCTKIFPSLSPSHIKFHDQGKETRKTQQKGLSN